MNLRAEALQRTCPTAEAETQPARGGGAAGSRGKMPSVASLRQNPRPTCRRCHRPDPACVCAALPRVDNRTRIVVLQHPHEGRHPLGTARLLSSALSRLELVRFEPAAPRPLVLPAGTALLYPHPEARRVDALSPAERPECLLILDGTWAHAKSMYKALPALGELTHLAIAPRLPSRYRVRREPRAECLSTVEAVCEALGYLEPETAGLDLLVTAFTTMIDRHIGLRQTRPSLPYKRHPKRRARRWAEPLAGSSNLIVAYGEHVGVGDRPELLSWSAVRLADGACFASLVRPEAPPRPARLVHMGIASEELLAAPTLARVREDWKQFCRGATVAAWSQSCLDLLALLGEPVGEPLLLKALYCNLRRGAAGHLEEALEREGLAPEPLGAVRGRTAERLGGALAMTRWLLRQAPVS